MTQPQQLKSSAVLKHLLMMWYFTQLTLPKDPSVIFCSKCNTNFDGGTNWYKWPEVHLTPAGCYINGNPTIKVSFDFADWKKKDTRLLYPMQTLNKKYIYFTPMMEWGILAFTSWWIATQNPWKLISGIMHFYTHKLFNARQWTTAKLVSCTNPVSFWPWPTHSQWHGSQIDSLRKSINYPHQQYSIKWDTTKLFHAPWYLHFEPWVE